MTTLQAQKSTKVALAVAKIINPSSSKVRFGNERVNAHNPKPFSKLRPAGTLQRSPEFMNRARPNSGSLFFYNNYVKKPLLAYNSLAIACLFPELTQKTLTGPGWKTAKELFSTQQKEWSKQGISAYFTVKKEQAHFTAKVPFSFLFGEYLIETLAGTFHGEPVRLGTHVNLLKDLNPQVENVEQTGPTTTDFTLKKPQVFIPVSKLRDMGGHMSGKMYAQLKALKGDAGIILEHFPNAAGGHGILLSLQLEFSKLECEYLCQSNWLEIRPIDFFGLIREWSGGRLGVTGNPPRYAISLQRIAAEVPKNSEPRVSKDLGVLLDENAELLWIPEEADSINKYDTELAAAMLNDDGTYGISLGTRAGRKHPPSQIVFVDWANLKMAYSDTHGHLQVKGLDRTQPASAIHYRRVLDQRILSSDPAESFISFMWRLCAKLNTYTTNTDVLGLVRAVLALPQHEGEVANDITLQNIYDAGDHLQVARELRQCVETVLQYSKESISNLFAEYSVSTMMGLIAWAKIFHECGPKYSTIRAQDNELRKAYTQQGLKPDFQLQPVPFMAQDRGMLPHQVRVTNRLSDSPDFAVLPVAAGGGKTPLAVYDVLKEMGNGTVQRALIMCPSHLVGQYVTEFTYFTEGRLNVIAINTYTILKHGLDGLQKLLVSAPINTVVVTDYNIAVGGKKSFEMGYGTAVASVFPVVEMLRRFAFDYVFLDESHYLKAATSRQAAVARLVTDIKKKRLASGTLTPNSIVDLVKQVSLMDPTIYGSPKDFVERYALETRGGKVLAWKPGAEREIMAQLKSSVVWAPASRKEWAAILPKLLEEGETVQLSINQQGCYNDILASVVQTLQAAMEADAALKKALMGGDEDGDEGTTMDLDSMLKPYLARLEQFVTAPGSDELGKVILKGDDLISPKVRRVAEIIRKHLDSNTPGKILIFTNYIESAKAVYEGLPDDLRAMCIHYTADQKAECGAQFEHDDRKKIMVGVEQSMNTGLNLQFCSRLIRIDAVWTPGALEQGNSRIGRPNIKIKETRSTIFINWISADKTIDITKMAYLFAKQVTIGKFEEAGNPLYDRVDPPPLFSMTLDTIAASNTQTSEDIDAYFSAYAAFKKAQVLDYKQYREQHPEDLNADGTIKMAKIERSANLPGSTLMYRVPYVPGTQLYKADALGLQRYDHYMRLNEDDLQEDDDTSEDAEDDVTNKELNRLELEKVAGMAVHTEFGDGTIVKLNRRAVWVELSDGSRVRVNKLAAFVITRAQTNAKDMRTLVLKQVGDIPFDVPVDIQVKDAKKVMLPKGSKKNAPAPVEDARISVALRMVVMNDFIGLEMTDTDKNPAAARALQAVGFQQPRAYVYAEMPTADHMFRQFAAWTKAGFKFHKEYNEACKATYLNLSKLRKGAANLIGQATASDLRNFFRLQIKPVPDPKLLCPYPLIIDHKLYIALPLEGHPASRKALSVRVAGVKWMEADTKNSLSVFMPSLSSFDNNMHALLNTGIEVTTIKALIARRARLHRNNPKLYDGFQTK